MAEIAKNPSARSVTISAVGYCTIGDADAKLVSAFSIHLVASGFTGSITIEGRNREAEANTDSVAYSPIVYHASYLNGAVSDGALHSDAITATSIIVVPASGMSVRIDCTSRSAGSVKAYWTPVTA